MANNVVFSAENILSTLGITMNDNFNLVFEQDPDAIDITSRFLIESKERKYPYYFASDNFENSDKPGFMASVSTKMTKDGIVTTLLDFQNPKMIRLMKIVNNYVKIFMAIYDRPCFHHYAAEFLNLQIMTDYDISSGLILRDITLSDLVLVSPFETNHYAKEIAVDYLVNHYTEKLGLANINEDTDIDKLLVLIRMQKIVDDMVHI